MNKVDESPINWDDCRYVTPHAYNTIKGNLKQGYTPQSIRKAARNWGAEYSPEVVVRCFRCFRGEISEEELYMTIFEKKDAEFVPRRVTLEQMAQHHVKMRDQITGVQLNHVNELLNAGYSRLEVILNYVHSGIIPTIASDWLDVVDGKRTVEELSNYQYSVDENGVSHRSSPREVTTETSQGSEISDPVSEAIKKSIEIEMSLPKAERERRKKESRAWVEKCRLDRERQAGFERRFGIHIGKVYRIKDIVTGKELYHSRGLDEAIYRKGNVYEISGEDGKLIFPVNSVSVELQK